jgi:DNA-binding NarL/FixJ family response regulator
VNQMPINGHDLVHVSNLRVLLVDDIAVLRDGLRVSLGSEAGIEVVGAARTVPEALRIAAQTAPQLVVADLQIGGQSLADLVAGLARIGCSARVLVLTSQAGEEHMRMAMLAGARAYLLKDDGYAELLEALRVVGAGRRFFSDSVESRILAQYAERLAARFAVAAAPITPREREVLALIGAGEPNKTIAKTLHLSVKTVEKHRSNLMRKLGLHNTAAVTVYAIRQGLVGRAQATAGRGANA